MGGGVTDYVNWMKVNSRMQIEAYGLQEWFFKHALKYRFYYFKNSVSFSSLKFNRMGLSGWFYDTFGKRILICRFDVDEKRKNTIQLHNLSLAVSV